MFERYLTDTLKEHFSQFFVLHPDQLEVSAWRGEINLSNLQIKATALSALLPSLSHTFISHGQISQFQLTIPWQTFTNPTNNNNSGCSLTLTDLEIIIHDADPSLPNIIVDSSATLRTLKEKHISTLLSEALKLRAEQLFQSSTATRAASTKSIKERWVKRIIANVLSSLTVTVKNVHIRYEHHASNGKVTAVGLTLRQFFISSPSSNNDEGDADDVPAPNPEPNSTTQKKLAAVYQLGVYWDSNSSLIPPHLLLSTPHPDASQFIIEPMSPSLEFSINTASATANANANAGPKFMAHLRSSSTNVKIPRRVLSDLSTIKQHFRNLEAHETFYRHRPSTRPTQSPAAWWRYAFLVVKTTLALGKNNIRRQPQNWSKLAKVILMRKPYVELYTKLVILEDENESADGEVDLDVDVDVTALQAMEERLDASDIVFFRMAALAEADKNNSKDQLPVDAADIPEIEEDGGVFSWFKSFSTTAPSTKASNSNSNSNSTPNINTFSHDFDKAKLYESIALSIAAQENNTNLSSSSSSSSNTSSSSNSNSNTNSNSILWDISASLDSVTILAEDSTPTNSSLPILQTSFSLTYHSITTPSSWNVAFSLDNVQVRDLCPSVASITLFPLLLSRKNSTLNTSLKQLQVDSPPTPTPTPTPSPDLTVSISFSPSHVALNLILSPLEIVYSTDATESLTHLFQLNNVESTNLESYQTTLSASLSNWRSRRKTDLIHTLSTRKSYDVNVQVTAPQLFFPEDVTNSNKPMVIVDLGHLSFQSAPTSSSTYNQHHQYDNWNLLISNMQMLSTSITHKRKNKVPYSTIIEPFDLSLELNSALYLHPSEAPNLTRIKINALLPRLSFNVTASVSRLLSRLSKRWDVRKLKYKESSLNNLKGFVNGNGDDKMKKRTKKCQIPTPTPTATRSPSSSPKLLEFSFSAPLISFLLTNDVDGRANYRQPPLPPNPKSKSKSKSSLPPAPILLLKIEGITAGLCKYSSTFSQFVGTMKSLQGTDLYQQAGESFARLVSSKNPDGDDLESSNLDNFDDKDLMVVSVKSDNSHKEVDVLFDELYVEWNPETLSAIHYCLQTPEDLVNRECDLDELINNPSNSLFATPLAKPESPPPVGSPSSPPPLDLNFFDACENENSSSNSFYAVSAQKSFLSPQQNYNNFFSPIQPSSVLHSAFNIVADSDSDDDSEDAADPTPQPPTFTLKLVLAKLRVRFNKDSRSRRLIVAQVDRTNVYFIKKSTGGSKTVCDFGNFTLIDNSTDGGSIYSEILGLNTAEGRQNSLVNLIFETFPRLNKNNDSNNKSPKPSPNSVFVDGEAGTVDNCDYHLSLELSPMRFVYIQQLWLEVIDYLFVGILGDEVWGKFQNAIDNNILDKLKNSSNPSKSTTPSPSPIPIPIPPPAPTTNPLPNSDAPGINFLKLSINIQNPTLILPVHYRSPHFISLKIKSVNIANYFLGQPELFKHNLNVMQWYNNLNITGENIVIKSHTNKLLSLPSGINLTCR